MKFPAVDLALELAPVVFGLGFSAVTVATGLIDYLTITPGTPMKRTATLHALSNATGTVFFVIAAIVQYDGFRDGNVTTGGSITFVHGMRVLELPGKPTRSAITPGGKRKDEAAA